MTARKMISARVSEDGYQVLLDYARRNQLSWSETLRRALARGITELIAEENK
jgi:hypothetical protein